MNTPNQPEENVQDNLKSTLVSKNNNKRILLSILVILVLMVVGIVLLLNQQNTLRLQNSQQNDQQNQANTDTSDNSNNEEELPADETPTDEDSVVAADYTSETYGFSLSFPESWDGYLSTITPGDELDTICFYFEDQGQDFCILQILAVKQEFEANHQKILETSTLAENEEYIFAGDYDVEGLCVQFNDFQCERSGEVSSILETFQLN